MNKTVFNMLRKRLYAAAMLERGNSSVAGAIVLAIVIIAVIIIGGLLLWSYTELTWWEDLVGKTRWDKFVDIFR